MPGELNNIFSEGEKTILIAIPFNDQKSSNNKRKLLKCLSNKFGIPLQPAYSSRKTGNILKVKETKPKIVREQFSMWYMRDGQCWLNQPTPAPNCSRTQQLAIELNNWKAHARGTWNDTVKFN